MTNSVQRALLIGLPFAVLGGLQIVPFFATRELSRAGTKATQQAHLISKDSLGKLPTGWTVLSSKRVTRDSLDAEGHYSVTFEVNREPTISGVRISLDYPFIMRWHNLTGCYEFSGWQSLKEEVISVGRASPWPFARIRLRNEEHREATLLFSIFDAKGVGIEPPDEKLIRAIWQRFQKKTNVLSPVPSYFQFQLFAPDVNEGTDEAEILELFLNSREEVRSRVADTQE